jgi:ABC-type antimicrobial peptide transport system permease subunit
MMLAARASTRPEDLTQAIRAAIRELDPAQPVYHVKTLETLVGDSTLPSRVSADMMSLFSALALALAAIGIYGVVAYGVSQQAREFGVRMALGATRRDVVRLVLRSGGRMVGAGIGIGMVSALGLSRLIQGALVGVNPTDPLTYATVAAVLGATGLFACAIPAVRASAARPVRALRAD